MPADNSMMSTIIMVVLMVAAFWLLLIRPAQKKQKQQQQLVSQLGVGSRVMLSGGVFGTIVQSGEKQAVVEVSPGVEMTILKQAIIRVVDPSEEEFEYDDVTDTPTEGTVIDITDDAPAVLDGSLDSTDRPDGAPGFERRDGDSHRN